MKRNIVVVLGLVGLMLGGCKAASGLGASADSVGSAGGELGGGLSGKCSGDFGADASAQKLEVFLSSAATFTGAAADLETSLQDACKRMGGELDLKPEELSGDVKTVCNAVAAKLKADFSSLKAEAKLKVSVAVTPPKCEVSVDAYAKCAGECNVDVKPGELKLECEGGEISGKCDAQCEGSCSVEASGECKGACEGSCSGSCTGKCQGACDGKCSSKNAKGECNGKCEGTCNGTCTAGCTGECSGECKVEAKGKCEGECSGGCSVEYKEPRCSGEVKAPEVKAECKASCDAKLNAEAKCTKPKATLIVTGKVKGDAEAKLAKLRAALAAGYDDVVAIKAKLERVAGSGQALVSASVGVPGAVGSLGLSAAACATDMVAKLPKAVGQVSASVDVSVNVSAAASGSASAN